MTTPPPHLMVRVSGNDQKDTHILVFTREGKFLRQIGRAGTSGGSNDTSNLARATQMRVDLQSNEVFVSDGEQNQNHRVIVFDSESGAYKRHWGAYGEKPDAPPRRRRLIRLVHPPDSSAMRCIASGSIATGSCMCAIAATAGSRFFGRMAAS